MIASNLLVRARAPTRKREDPTLSEVAILAILSRRSGGAHSAEVHRAIVEGGVTYTASAVTYALHRLVAQEWVHPAVLGPRPARGGRRVLIYVITERGALVVENAIVVFAGLYGARLVPDVEAEDG